MRTHEEVVGIGVGATNLEELHQVVELAVDITTDGDGAFLARRDQLEHLARRRASSTYHGLHIRLLL